MKVALLTLHTPLNFGSALQAFALCKVLEDLGHEVELVDYWRPADRGIRLFRNRVADGDENLVTRLGRAVDRTVEDWIARRNFAPFLRAETPLSRRHYRDVDRLEKWPPHADVYMTGSDQVWNSVYNNGIDRALYLDFLPSDATRVAFAASFGLDRLPVYEHDETRRLLSRYRAIAVREQQGIEILSHLGLQAERVLDPTLLLDADNWTSLVGTSQNTGRYVLCYCVEEERMDTTAKLARRVADRLGDCRVYNVTFGGLRRKMDGIDKNLYFSSPKEFLRLFAGAEFVVTGSFHGTAFSINFSKPFYSIAPPLYGNRARELLDSVGLKHRFISPELPFDVEVSVDYENARMRLDDLRARSIEFLDSALRRAVASGQTPVVE